MTNDQGSPNAYCTNVVGRALRLPTARLPTYVSHCQAMRLPYNVNSSFLHTRTQRSLFEIISDRERTYRFQEGNLPGGLLRPRAQVRQAISFGEGVLLTNCRAFVSDANSRWRFTETPYKYDVCVPDCRKRKTRVANRRDESGRGPL
jgi:hypothetical protein